MLLQYLGYLDYFDGILEGREGGGGSEIFRKNHQEFPGTYLGNFTWYL